MLLFSFASWIVIFNVMDYSSDTTCEINEEYIN